MYYGCYYCPKAFKCNALCGAWSETCDSLLDEEIESARDEYYKAWLDYISEYND